MVVQRMQRVFKLSGGAMFTFCFTFLIFIPESFTSSEVKYEGCMVPENLLTVARDLPSTPDSGLQARLRGSFTHQEGKEGWMSVQDCVRRCWVHNFLYAALQGGRRCFCSTDVREMMTVPDRFCFRRCEGSCYQHCGGTVAMSVYYTGFQNEEPIQTFPVNIAYKGYMGCVFQTLAMGFCANFTGADRAQKRFLGSYRMTPQLCALYCYAGDENMKFDVAVTASPEVCCCGNDIPAVEEIIHEVARLHWGIGCGTPCKGASEAACTGVYRSEYETLPLSAVYNAKKMSSIGMPHLPELYAFRKDNPWLNLNFPKDNDFLISKELQDELENPSKQSASNSKPTEDMLQASLPVVEPENSGVQVLNAPEESSNKTVIAIMCGVGVAVVILGGTVVFLMKKRQEESSKKSGPEETEAEGD